MKKVLSIALVFVMLFSLLGMVACSGGKSGRDADNPTTEVASVPGETEETGTPEPNTYEPGDSYVGGEESFTLSADKSVVAPGDTVTVTLHAQNCKNVACFDLLISADAALTEGLGEELESGKFITSVIDTPNGIQFSAIVATTSNIDSLDMMTITYKVAADAAPGDTLSVNAAFSQYLVGTDESGENVADATGLVSVAPLTLTVG